MKNLRWNSPARWVYTLLRFPAVAFLLVVSGCSATVPGSFDPDDPGKISGELMVFWDGYDSFIYYPYYRDPLTYQLPKDLAAKLDIQAIRPGAIYTDGGSIPQALRNLTGLSPWGYGPAYIVHDWLFVAHHCIVVGAEHKHDKRDRAEVEKVRKIDFDMSADILALVIAALEKQKKVPPINLAPSAIYGAVDSFVAERLWNTKEPESCKPLEPEKIAKIEEDLKDKGPQVMAAEARTRRERGDGPFLIYRQSF